jgi:hypothetical protein
MSSSIKHMSGKGGVANLRIYCEAKATWIAPAAAMARERILLRSLSKLFPSLFMGIAFFKVMTRVEIEVTAGQRLVSL